VESIENTYEKNFSVVWSCMITRPSCQTMTFTRCFLCFRCVHPLPPE